MTQFNPGTKLTAVCTFTKAGVPGKFDGAAVWSSNNAKDVVTQVDDPANGVSTATIDGSANATGDSSVFTCSADADLGKGKVNVSATSDTAEWTDAVDIEADGATIAMSQPA